MLAADVVVYGDGGGKAPSWPKPIYGRERVARLLAGTLAQAKELGATVRAVHVNGQPGVMFLDDEDRVGAVMSVDVADGLVQTIRGITNPDKLEHLGPVSDVRRLLRRHRGA
jgi:RNA polymerase sigma-70 factor (ECF subfamily)